MLSIRKLPLAVAISVLGFSAFSSAQAATEGLPFKIVAYDATYTLHPNGSYTARIHEVSSPLSHFGVQKFAQAHKQYPAKMADLQVTKAYTLSPSGKNTTLIKTRFIPGPCP